MASLRKCWKLSPGSVVGRSRRKQYDTADRYAMQTEQEVTELLKRHRLDQDRSLPLALGAAIEVQGQVMAAKGERDRALDYLRQATEALPRHIDRGTHSEEHQFDRPRRKARAAAGCQSIIGAIKPKSLAELRGRPVLLFLWAHWCSDCKMQGPVLARLN